MATGKETATRNVHATDSDRNGLIVDAANLDLICDALINPIPNARAQPTKYAALGASIPEDD
jgi:hypothetical protein